MTRVINFSAGPAALPEAVLEQAAAEMLDWRGSGTSVMEMSHRGKEFMGIAAQAEADLRALMAIPDNYKVLFLQGGASLQFAMVPFNLLRGRKVIDFVNTGHWSKAAMKEAQRFATVNEVASGADHHFTSIPDQSSWGCSKDAAYLHYTPNETIHGVEFHWVPEPGDAPLVADLSSTILSRPLDVSRFGLIYAGAQKNIGPAGITVVIVRDDLIGHAMPGTPTMLDYRVQADSESMYNTPPTYAWYLAGLVFQWLKAQGGLAAMEQLNIAKADCLYQAIDGSGGFYRSPVAVDCRSRMNVPFRLHDDRLDDAFLKESAAAGLVQLKGHRVVGGMRASLYNAMPLAGVQALVAFMHDFQRRYG